MIQLYTGDGKGKTTASTGQAVRAAGRGFRVVFAQFMKGNDTGELHSLKRIENIRILRSGKQFGFYSTLSEKEKEELTEIHNGILNELLRSAEEKSCEMIILDEITYPVNWGLLDADRLKKLLAFSGDSMEIVLTGRNAAPFLRDCADYITEMKCIRHPYEKGIAARKGIEY